MTASLRVLVTGAAGQLGRALAANTPPHVELRGLTRTELDIADLASVQTIVESFRPDVLINAAAYTAVDQAESDVAVAETGNIQGPRNLALAVQRLPGGRLLHISTDFVFDGRQSVPYQPNAPTAPLGVYGRTKLEGEQAILQVLGRRSLVLRTAWVYGATGKNFLRTMLRLMRERGAVRVVADQVGTPTCTHSLAEVLWRLAARPDSSGVFHWTDAGVASWYDFAVAIAEDGVAAGILCSMPEVTPIATADYPTPARRPAYSVLDKSATHNLLELPTIHWRTRLREVMGQLHAGC